MWHNKTKRSMANESKGGIDDGVKIYRLTVSQFWYIRVTRTANILFQTKNKSISSRPHYWHFSHVCPSISNLSVNVFYKFNKPRLQADSDDVTSLFSDYTPKSSDFLMLINSLIASKKVTSQTAMSSHASFEYYLAISNHTIKCSLL